MEEREMTNNEMVARVVREFGVDEEIVRDVITAGVDGIPYGEVLGRSGDQTVVWTYLGVMVQNETDGTCTIHGDAATLDGALMTYAANRGLAAQKSSMGRIS